MTEEHRRFVKIENPAVADKKVQEDTFFLCAAIKKQKCAVRAARIKFLLKLSDEDKSAQVIKTQNT